MSVLRPVAGWYLAHNQYKSNRLTIDRIPRFDSWPLSHVCLRYIYIYILYVCPVNSTILFFHKDLHGHNLSEIIYTNQTSFFSIHRTFTHVREISPLQNTNKIEYKLRPEAPQFLFLHREFHHRNRNNLYEPCLWISFESNRKYR